MYYFTPVNAVQQVMASQGTSTTPKIQATAVEIVESVFWDSGASIRDFLLHGITINAQYYSDLLCNYVH
jgi:hypothetical protein